MRGFALAPLLAAGCLYTGVLNHAPSLQLDQPSVSTTYKGGVILVDAHASDDTDSPGDLLANMQLELTSAVEGAPPDPTCDYSLTHFGGHIQLQIFRTGTFSLKATTTDHLAARSNSSTVIVTITDAPPRFGSSPAIVPTSAGNACNLFAAGDTIPLGFNGTVADADQFSARNPACGTVEMLSYTWRITSMPGSARPVLTAFANNDCMPPDAASGTTLTLPSYTTQVCLWTDPTAMTTSTAMYSVELSASDGTNSSDKPVVANVTVSPDQPPCITGTQPVAGSYVVDRTLTQHFEVEGVFDDRDPFGSARLIYAWSVWRESDPSWRAVPLRPQSTYDLDTSGFLVGEKVRVRVEAIDRTGGRAVGCDPNADDCVVTSCIPVGACHKWKTWDLELR